MVRLPFDPQDPPRTPPPQVRRPMLWRMGWRLVTDHRPRVTEDRSPTSCRSCGHRWPCEPQLLGRRGLVASLRDGSADRGGRGEVADGRLVLAPPPSRRHEQVVAALAARLRAALPEATAVWTGRPVPLPDGDAPVPDVVVTADGQQPGVAVSTVATVVEVVGPDGRFLDRVWKRERYADAGIPCFWRVELTSCPGYLGRLPVVVVRLRDRDGWQETIAAAGQVCELPVAYGRGPGGVGVTVPVRLDPAVLTRRAGAGA